MPEKKDLRVCRYGSVGVCRRARGETGASYDMVTWNRGGISCRQEMGSLWSVSPAILVALACKVSSGSRADVDEATCKSGSGNCDGGV